MKSRKITITLAMLMLLFLAGYIYFASTMSSMGYELDKKDKSISVLTEQKNDLIIELANQQSPDNILNQGEQLDLVEVNAISRYIDTRATSLGALTP